VVKTVYQDLEGFMSANFAPRVFLISILVLVSVMLIRGLMTGKTTDFVVPQVKLLGMTAGLCILFVILIYKLGFFATTMIFLLTTSRLLGKFRWTSTIIVAFLFTLSCDLLFIRLLDVKLPHGIVPF